MTVTIDAIYDGKVLQPQVPLDLKPNAHYQIIISDTLRSSVSVLASSGTRAPDDEVARAWRIYDRKLKAVLESEHNGKLVALHLDSEDYEVARRTLEAWKPLKARHPEGEVVVMDIGPVSEHNALNLRRSGVLRSKGVKA